MSLPPPPVTQAEAMLALLSVYQSVLRLLRRRLGRETRQDLEDIRALIAPLITRQNGHR
jgi:hypothetical protein